MEIFKKVQCIFSNMFEMVDERIDGWFQIWNLIAEIYDQFKDSIIDPLYYYYVID